MSNIDFLQQVINADGFVAARAYWPRFYTLPRLTLQRLQGYRLTPFPKAQGLKVGRLKPD